VAALRSGEVNRTDNISPTDVKGLKDGGFEVAQRPPFTLAFLGFNQTRAPLGDKRVRQAIAYALDRKAIIRTTMPEGTMEANQWLPKGMQGWNPNVTTYDYDPVKARQLLEQAGVIGQTIEHEYQSSGASACMPAPEDTLNILRAQIEAVALKVKPVAIPQSEYGNRIYGTADHGLEVSCWIGQVNIANSFLGLAFGFPSPEWGFEGPKLYKGLAAAATITTREKQSEAYEQLSDRVMRENLPGVPFASAGSYVGLSPQRVRIPGEHHQPGAVQQPLAPLNGDSAAPSTDRTLRPAIPVDAHRG
jgi:peptide/nickel transport system substrate-binding protein